MPVVPSASTWGSSAATKHALLLHGLTSSSHIWSRVATSLASQGYLVTAPNLLGHASRDSTDYRFKTIVEDLRPYLTPRNYDLIIGHSIGAIAILELFQHLPESYPTAIVLVDPPLQVSQEQVDFFENAFADSVERVKDAEVIAAENPLWTREDCIMRELATRLCPVETIHGVLRENKPWSFAHNLYSISSQWNVTALIADPAKFKICSIDDIKPFPQIRAVIVPEAGHWIQCDFPDVVVKEALMTVAELKPKLV